jgi:hypothetical protein
MWTQFQYSKDIIREHIQNAHGAKHVCKLCERSFCSAKSLRESLINKEVCIRRKQRETKESISKSKQKTAISINEVANNEGVDNVEYLEEYLDHGPPSPKDNSNSDVCNIIELITIF